ncbi:MAG: carbohydrate-binding family 9-like protein [Chryseolinea sp.]
MPTPFIAQESYSISSIDLPLTVLSAGKNPAWDRAAGLTSFSYPWDSGEPPSTMFKALHSKDWIFFQYAVKDDNIQILVNVNDKIEVIGSDRVEIFFRTDDKLAPYYCLEIDPLGRILDYKAKFHRQFDMTWSWPEGHLIAKAERDHCGYTVEVAISKESLINLGLLKKNKIEAGIFRANCTTTAGDTDHMKWISWLKPDSPTPDFHLPSAFGVLLLED